MIITNPPGSVNRAKLHFSFWAAPELIIACRQDMIVATTKQFISNQFIHGKLSYHLDQPAGEDGKRYALPGNRQKKSLLLRE